MKKIYNLLYREVCLTPAKAMAALQPRYSAVNHNNGRIEATDGYKVVAIPFDYPEELEGKMLDKQGEEVEGKFPNVNSVFPHLNSTEKVEIDLDMLEKAVNNIAKLKFKDGKDTLTAYIDILGDASNCYSAPYLATLIKVFKEIKKKYELRVSDRKALMLLDTDYIFEDNYAKALMVPIITVDTTSERYFTLETALAYEKPKPQPKKAWYE